MGKKKRGLPPRRRGSQGNAHQENKIWVGTAVNQGTERDFSLGDRRAVGGNKPLWLLIKGWKSFFYVTDGYVVYPQFIDEIDHIVSQPYMRRVEGENPRLRHYLAR